MLEEYRAAKVGEDALEPGLKMERIRLKARRLEGLPDETIDDILKEAEENANEG
jgi:hypothetical protein